MPVNKVGDHAVAHLTEPTATPAEMVAAGNKHISGIKGCPHLPSAPDVGARVTAWEAENTKLAGLNQHIIDLENQLALAKVDRVGSARRWVGLAAGTANAITIYADGSVEVVTSFAMSVAARVASPLETVPENVRGVRGKARGDATVRWQTHKGHHGYMVQTATNPADPATHSTPVHSSKGRFVVPKLTPGSTLYVRVAACDSRLPATQTDYTDWVAVIVSA